MSGPQSPENLVLTADLTWAPISELEVGDEVASFERTEDTEPYQHSKLRTSTVSSVLTQTVEAVRIHTDRGSVVVNANQQLSPEHHAHREASRFKAGHGIRFVAQPGVYMENQAYRFGYVHGAFAGDGCLFTNKTTNHGTIRCQDEVIVTTVHSYAPPEYGLKLKKKTSDDLFEVRTTKGAEVDEIRLSYPIDESSIDNPDYCRGWLAGMFDTDGSFDGKTVRFCQKKPEQREILKETLSVLGYDFAAEPEGIRVRGTGSRLQVLTEIRPQVHRKVRNYVDRSWKGTAKVHRVESLGEREITSLATDPGQTYIVDGFCAHDVRQLTLC
ncbi:LAGLIDADG family homing endonuclease [Haloferax gibbonsii]|uniref:LAGLIDADG family homing endonuclease n=1 Tax=Haloferax gibbonsii TaxID=35746 RepID=UPI000B0C8F06|nr:LAGLIDADG family homing endonuclease [Haloferax gibbonsii]